MSKKVKNQLGVTVGGPIPGTHFIVKPNKHTYFFPTPSDTQYCGVFYVLINGLTPLKEHMAIFNSHAARR